MKNFLALIAVFLLLALSSATATANEQVQVPASLIERHFEYLAHRDRPGYQAIQIALTSPSIKDNPREATFESTELDNYGHAWVYLNGLADYAPLSNQALISKKAYLCYLIARRNAISTADNVEDEVTGSWLDLADRCASILHASLSQWADEISVPLVRKDLEGSAPYRMFFPFDTAKITTFGENILQYISRFEQVPSPREFIMEGHADRSGASSYNMALSQKRAEAVGTRLSAHTKGDTTLRFWAAGETKPLTTTQDGIRHPRNRRVEIVVNRPPN